jgi:hypothetical protein
LPGAALIGSVRRPPAAVSRERHPGRV